MASDPWFPGIQRHLGAALFFCVLGGCVAGGETGDGEPELAPAAERTEHPSADPTHTPGAPPSHPALDRTWVLLEGDGSQADPPEPAPGGGWILLATSNGELRGWTGCNRVAAPFTLEGASLRFAPLRTTDRLCPEPEWEAAESRLLRALERTSSVQVEGGVLRLLGANGQTLGAFQISGGGSRVPQAPLQGQGSSAR
jgi:heat shock protein HslJ